MTKKYTPETLKAIIQEGLRQGYDRNFIANKLRLSLAEIARLEDGDLRDDATDDDLAGLLHMVELAEAKLAAYGPGWVLRPKLSPTMNLAVLGRALGADGVIELVAKYFQATGCIDLPAASLNLPQKFVHACIAREMAHTNKPTLH